MALMTREGWLPAEWVIETAVSVASTCLVRHREDKTPHHSDSKHWGGAPIRGGEGCKTNITSIVFRPLSANFKRETRRSMKPPKNPRSSKRAGDLHRGLVPPNDGPSSTPKPPKSPSVSGDSRWVAGVDVSPSSRGVLGSERPQSSIMSLLLPRTPLPWGAVTRQPWPSPTACSGLSTDASSPGSSLTKSPTFVTTTFESCTWPTFLGE